MASGGEKRACILVVDDSAETLEILQRNLSGRSYRVLTATGVAEALRVLESSPVDLVVTDCKMPKVSGIDLVRHVAENLRDTEVMMITGYPSVPNAVEAMKVGAEEYLAKPFTDGELFEAVERALGKLHRRRTARGATGGPAVGFAVPAAGLIGDSKAMRDVHRAIAKAARSSATVLVTGESGTGKELVARAIHYGGARAAAPLLPVHCGGIPETLIESELFGHVKGAFTGATDSRAGFFQTADGGTLFLDEISEVSLPTQVKLLRVLQEHEVSMVGMARPRKIDVRILAATNKDLEQRVRQGTFREDLFFRLNVLTIEVPPLRSRGDDVLTLVRHFAVRHSVEAGRAPLSFTDDALRVLRHYPWPGNVRELENLVQRLSVMTDAEVVGVPDLPSHMRFSAASGTCEQRTLAEVEAEHIRNVLAGVGGNKTRAAEILGIDRKTLREKLQGRR